MPDDDTVLTQTQDQQVDEVKESETQEIDFNEDEVEEKEEVKVEEPVKVEEEEEEIDLEKVSIETRGKEEEKIDYGEDVDPDDIKIISRIVEKQTESVKKQLQEAQDRLEVDDFVSKNPEFNKYKPVIMKYLSHPVYSKIPVKNIAAMVASNDLLRIGARKEREAQAKADATKNPVQPVRKPEANQVDWSRVSKNDFEAQKRRILGQSN